MEIINAQNNTGLDNATGNSGGRLFNKNGMPNILRKGVAFKDKYSVYHILLNINNFKFITLIVAIYFIINLLFATIYFYLGVENLGLTENNQCHMNNFSNCFFFSAQTLTTVGYGRISPTSFSTNTVSAIESLIGLLLFALITGLSYGRFSKPKSSILFSKEMLIGKVDNKPALIVRSVCATEHLLSETEATITYAQQENINGRLIYQYYTLKLELSKIISFPLNWTLVHIIDEESPLFQLTIQDIVNRNAECIVFIKAYDEHYSSFVQGRSSYNSKDIIYNAKFLPMFFRDKNNTTTILEIDKLSDYELLNV